MRREPRRGGQPAGLRDDARSTGLGGRRRRAWFNGRGCVAPGVHAGADRDVIHSPCEPRPGVNPPGYATTPRQRELGDRRRRARFSGRGGVAPGVHAGAGRRDIVGSPRTPPRWSRRAARRRPVRAGWPAAASPVQRAWWE
ncbi:MAG: hypothetical protein R2838_06525 [Caldilineaceae bacterium]